MSRDLRKYAGQTNIRLIIGGLLLVFIVGSGLIYTFYGEGAMITGVICMFAGLSPIVLIVLFLYGLEWLAKRADSE